MKTQLKFIRQCGLILAVVLVTAACNKQDRESNAPDPVGLYALVSVDGKTVPATVSHGGAALQVLSGSFTISSNSTCSSANILVSPGGKEVTVEANATYFQNGEKLTMRWEGAGTTVGTIKGKTFTMENEGMEFVYYSK